MNNFCNLKCQSFFSLVNSFVLILTKLIDFLKFYKSQQFQAFFYISVVNISPVLIKLIWGSFFSIKPQRTFLSFSHFNAFGCCKQLESHCKCRLLLLTPNKVSTNNNCERFKQQMSKFLSFEGDNGVVMVNNADWLDNLNYIDFLREVGVHF